MNLFVYGTLQFEPVMRSLTGTWPPRVAATLSDHARYRVKGEVYPGIRQETGASVTGVVFRALPVELIGHLDAFEPPMYRRMMLPVETASGLLTAGVYVVLPDHWPRLSDRPWSPDEFRQRHLGEFITRRVHGSWD